MRTGDTVCVHRPEDKYQWRIIADTGTSLQFHLNEGNVLTSCVITSLYTQPYYVLHIKLKSEQIPSIRHRQVLSIPWKKAVQEKWVPFIRKSSCDSEPERVEVLTRSSSVYGTGGILTLVAFTDDPNKTP